MAFQRHQAGKASQKKYWIPLLVFTFKKTNIHANNIHVPVVTITGFKIKQLYLLRISLSSAPCCAILACLVRYKQGFIRRHLQENLTAHTTFIQGLAAKTKSQNTWTSIEQVL